MALMVESGFPGWRAVAMAWLSRSIAAHRAAESSVIVRDASVAVSMARSAMPGWLIDSGVSISTIPCPRNCDAGSLPVDEAATFGYPRERSFLNSGSRDLWLSATGAVVNGGWRPRTGKMRGQEFGSLGLYVGVQNRVESRE
jgi:hypothetical protein